MTAMLTRSWDTGLVRPYRNAPPDFREVYLVMGWDGIVEHYQTNYRCIRRWIEECGGEELRRERARITGSSLKPGLRSTRARHLLIGRTKRPCPYRTMAALPCREPRFWDMGLVHAEAVERARRHAARRLSPERIATIIEEEMKAAGMSDEFIAGLARAVQLLRGNA